MLDWFRDKTKPAPPEWLTQILDTEVGLMRNRRDTDNRSMFMDMAEATGDDTRLEALIHAHLLERLRSHFSGKDVHIYLEVTFFRPPFPMLVLKTAIQEGDWIYPQARYRGNLDFGPDPSA